TGLSTMLRGLKAYSSNLTAIVTVADDGGSSGKLRKQLNILPPGDIRNCLVALADSETQMTELFQYRFRDSVDPGSAAGGQHIARKSPGESGGDLMPAAASVTTMAPARYGEGLRDHAFGNLLIAAMCAINNGDFELGVRQTSRILKVRGRVLPSTDACVTLRAEMEDGSFIEGEVNIAASPLRIKRMYLSPQDARPMDEVLEAIDQADVIVMGPGSVFTSVIPNLLIRRIPEAIRKSRAKKIYVCNVMTQPGETDGFSAFDHVQAIAKHAQERVFDYVMVNTGRPDTERIEKYRSTGSLLVEADTDRIKAAGYRTITGNFINQTDVVRHEATRLAEAIIRLVA
ncbi:MAG TPA: gluconeogenesis factor YvcK family protein, partial [Chthonomonadales bacterium]|nr:gluconeogenesis factor YvcK family protein [Chthonomonadales bacterium]